MAKSTKKNKIPQECKDCTHLWKHGIKDGKHNMWCNAYMGAPAWKNYSHCKNTGFTERKIRGEK